MSIRWKLLWSYAAMLIFPLLFLVLVSGLLLIVFRGDAQNIKLFYESKIEGIEEADYHRLVKQTLTQNPQLLTDASYLQDLSDGLASRQISIYVREDNRAIFASSEIEDDPALVSGLPPYEHFDFHKEITVKINNSEWYQIVQYDLKAADDKPVSLFLLTKIDPLVHFAKKWFPILFIAAIAALLLTNIALTYYMSTRIIRPLLALRQAAGRFSEGELDMPIDVKGKDEIGQLGITFETMRVRLKESILLQMQYEKNRKELITNISHDLKTPITAIKGYVDGIMEGIADTREKHDRYMKTIASKADELDKLIDELFLYSKLDMQKVPFRMQPMSVRSLLNDWSDDLRFELEKNGVELQTDFNVQASVLVQIDPDSFKRVLGNIIQNSLKYMDKERPSIRLSAYTENGQATIVIEDNGSGIPADALPHIFDRFYRAEWSRNSRTGGSGLGLAIAMQIMLAHEGDIRAMSVEGEGTRVILTVPIEGGGADGAE
ncbi:sensor histidine kinase [Cohnella hashimotonis]|uniref:histidine kinase n=1 Tax=Cohnella hashimotonis TaxID=2826895 RepID=A0ABT6THN3_9BACL|nr:HAMP domain-containing sensor histidine kinase [Cohnella hashimotonis]MDI4646335.1 HAMP domain-containing sensor histidine kinase [Cohnella hashimotonis]